MKLRTIIIMGAILSVIVGFVAGKYVIADSPLPGSSADPVVSKSYVDKALEERLTELEKTVTQLSIQAQALQTTLNALQGSAGKTTTTPSKTTTTPPAATTPTTGTGSATPGTGTGTPFATTPGSGSSTSAVGKVCYVISTNNYVNLRSQPSTEASIIKKVNKGEPMGIQQEKDRWYFVKLGDGTTGWVASWVVEIK